MADRLARSDSTSEFVGPEPASGSLGRNLGIRLAIGWETSIGEDDRTLTVPNDRLTN
jgi:hypothetical protein